MPTPSPPPPENGFQRALNKFKARLKPEEKARCNVATLDDLKVGILTIQAVQRKRKELINMRRIQGFLEAMEQFGKVIEIFTNTSNMVAFVWGPVKLLLLTASSWSESFDALLDAYQTIATNMPIFQDYQELFKRNDRIQVVMESIWSDVLEFHIHALQLETLTGPLIVLRYLFRSLWKDFKSRFDHLIKDLQQQKTTLESHVNQIHIQHYESDRIKMQQEFELAQAQRSAEHYLFVQRWIRAESCIEDHEEHIRVRQEQHAATGEWPGRWVLDNENVSAWLMSRVPKASFLWINAIPGAGKSVLASVIIDGIKERNVGPVAFFYCRHQDPGRSSCSSVARALLSQLIAEQRHLVPYYNTEGLASGEVPLQSAKLYKKLLKHMLQNIPKAFLVVDGLDECHERERCQLLDFLGEAVDLCDNTEPGKIRVLILSRDELDLRKRLMTGMVTRLERGDLQRDIALYVRHRADRVHSKFSAHGLTLEDRGYIESNVLDRTEGMFLYAKLVMENLEGQPTLDYLREEMEPHRFPHGLGQAYSRTLDRIRRNPHKNDALVAHRILSLMICSIRPLRWREVQALISINLSEKVVEPTRRTAVHITEVCGSLISVLQGDRIEFVHTTAVFYILENGYISRFLAERSMASVCLLYLAFPCFGESLSATERVKLGSEGYYAFQDYAAAHWADHVLAVANTTDSAASTKDTDEDWVEDAFLHFMLRFEDDLGVPYSTDAVSAALPAGLVEFTSREWFPSIRGVWAHAKAVRCRTGADCDQLSLPSLAKVLSVNRQTLERLWEVQTGSGSGGRNPRALEFYGTMWFKCSRLSCYYFHEGFGSERLRKDHYNRHERPFRCEDDGCPGAVAGFASLNELEKHKRNLHPGIDKLSSTFARLKKRPVVKNGEAKYPCPRCPEKFKTRLDCRHHMNKSHLARLAPRVVDRY